MKMNVFERDCVKAAAAFQWRFYLFSSTHERRNCSLLEVKNFDDRFAPLEKKNLFDDNACVCDLRRNIYVRTQSSPELSANRTTLCEQMQSSLINF